MLVQFLCNLIITQSVEAEGEHGRPFGWSAPAICCVGVPSDGLRQLERLHLFKWDFGPTAVKWSQANMFKKCCCELSEVLLLLLLPPPRLLVLLLVRLREVNHFLSIMIANVSFKCKKGHIYRGMHNTHVYSPSLGVVN